MRSCPECQATVWEGAHRCRVCGADLLVQEQEDADDAARALIGRRLGGKFVLRELIGAGASGYVFRADQTTLGRTVAVKILRPHLTNDAELARRFADEALAASRINHPNAVSVIDYGQTDDGFLYIVMEYLRGRTLAQVIRNEFPVPVERAVALLCQVLDALEEAHAAGVVHADLKADNIVVETTRGGADLVKVVDFGIARMFEPVSRGTGELARARVVGTDPGSRTICGTPEYMAPEVIVGGETTPAADQYGAAIVLYEVLTGVTPFAGGGTIEVLSRHIHDAPPALADKRPDLVVPSAVADALWKAMSKNPSERFPDVGAFRAALGRARAQTSPTAGVEALRPCPSCGAESPARFKFCPECGERWEVTTGGHRRIELPLPAEARETARWQSAPRFSLPLVGRDAELAALREFLSGGGLASLLVVDGATGSGRSRLVREACTTASAGGMFVAIAGADPTGLATPWYPVRAAVAAILRLPPVCDAAELRAALEGLDLTAREVPGLLELFGQDGELGELEPAVRRRECSAVALRVLRAATAKAARAVLVFEDTERYDRLSLDLLQRLAEHPIEPGLRVVCTTTPEAASTWPEGVGRLALAPLDADAVDALIGAISEGDARASQPDAATLAQLAQGLPLHLEQALRYAREGGDLAQAPPGLADLIAARCDRLPARARVVLQAAATAGEEIPQPQLARVATWRGLDDDEIDAGLARLVLAGLVDIADGVVSFTHRLVREVALDVTPADVRHALHRAHAEALTDAGGSAAALGHHLAEADAHALAIPQLLAAGDDAVRHFDDDGACVMYQRALDSARRAAAQGDEQERIVDVLLASVKLADVLRLTNQLGPARGVVEEALSLCDGRHRTLEAQLKRAHAHLSLAGGAHDRALSTMREAAGLAMSSGNQELLAAIYLDLATVHMRRGQPLEAIDELGEGIDVVTLGEGVAGDAGPRSLWRVAARLAELQHAAGRLKEALVTGTHALRHAHRAGSALGRVRVNALLANMYEQARDLTAASRHRQAAVEELRRLGDRRTTLEMLQSRTHTAQLRIDLDGLDIKPIDLAPPAPRRSGKMTVPPRPA